MVADFDNLADQRVTVRMRAGGGEAEHRVTRLHAAAVENPVLFHDADTEAGEVEVAVRIHPRHFRSLAADERTACLPATLGDATDHGSSGATVELAGGVVVEEKEWLRALHEHVVDAHRYEIDAHALVAPHVDG